MVRSAGGVMGAIVDVLRLKQGEIEAIKSRFPASVFTNTKNRFHLAPRYRVIIPDLGEEEYYRFLVDSCLALSSANFLGRVESDSMFSRRMRDRVRANNEKSRRRTRAEYSFS